MAFIPVKIQKDFINLETRLIKLLPLSSQMLTLVKMAIWGKFPVNADIKFYVFKNQTSTQLEDLFLVCIQIPNIFSRHCVITYSPENPSREMIEGFDKLIDWENVNLFSQNNEGFATHLRILCNHHGNRSEFPEGIPGRMFFLDPKIASEYSTSANNNGSGENLQIRSLTSELIPEIMRNWKMSKPESKGPLEDAIKYLPSVGLFTKDLEPQLASSALMSTMGLINIVFTEESHRRKGLAALTVKNISKSIASNGWIPAAEIERCNEKSQAMLEKVGFKMAFDTFWFFFEK